MIGGDNVDVVQRAKRLEDYVVSIRRDLHIHPEVSMEEERTVRVVTTELEKMGIQYELVPYGGIIGRIDGKKQGKTLILRADLDALPMQEATENLATEKIVVSKNENAAHLCGHDGHTAMLLGAAKILKEKQDELNGTVLLAFERGEENGRGIYRLLKRLVEIGADGVWGIHLKNDLPTGKISVDSGPRMAGSFFFHIRINGKSGHGSRPDLATSPLDCFVDFYQALQAARLRSLDPFKPITYSIGKIHAGSAPNIIPSDVEFQGTVRFLHEEQGEKAFEEFNYLLALTCEKHGCTFEQVEEMRFFNLFVYNEATCATIAKEAIEKSLGEEALIHYPAWMASESFSLYQQYFPGVFAFVGIENETKGTGAEHHNEHFDIDEAALTYGVVATAQFAIDFLSNEKPVTYEKETRDVTTFFKENKIPIYYPED